MKPRTLFMLLALSLVFAFVLAAPALAVTSHGNGGTQMPALYDGHPLTITFMELSPKAEAMTLAKNKSINTIYQSDQAVAAGFNFVSVLDAVPGPGFNPLWQEVQIQFNTISPQQFLSDNDILAAAALGQITLVPTTEIYICAVVGHK
jgi:hypothetical protein